MAEQYRRGLHVWPGHAGDGDVAIGLAAARDFAHQDGAIREAHDFVIRQTGRRRAGPVQWLVFEREEGLAQLEQLDIDPGAGLLEYLSKAPTSLLVIAMVATDKPRRSRRRRR